jgi:hypothetical protein
MGQAGAGLAGVWDCCTMKLMLHCLFCDGCEICLEMLCHGLQ